MEWWMATTPSYHSKYGTGCKWRVDNVIWSLLHLWWRLSKIQISRMPIHMARCRNIYGLSVGSCWIDKEGHWYMFWFNEEMMMDSRGVDCHTGCIQTRTYFMACCILYIHLLDYNGGGTWWELTIRAVRKGEQEDEQPVGIPNDHSFLRSKYRPDPEFVALLQHDMESPSHELRTTACNYNNHFAQQVEMVARLNQLQSHYVRTVNEGKLMKLKKMRDVQYDSNM
jgi:hypothetical protein